MAFTSTISGTVNADGSVNVGGTGSLPGLVAAVGVLVADGASPTQAHVNVANAALPVGDFLIAFDDTKVKTSQHRASIANLISKFLG